MNDGVDDWSEIDVNLNSKKVVVGKFVMSTNLLQKRAVVLSPINQAQQCCYFESIDDLMFAAAIADGFDSLLRPTDPTKNVGSRSTP